MTGLFEESQEQIENLEFMVLEAEHSVNSGKVGLPGSCGQPDVKCLERLFSLFCRDLLGVTQV